MSKFKATEVRELLMTTRLTPAQIKRETGASLSLISRVNAGLVGPQEGVEYPIRVKGAERVRRVRNLLEQGWTIDEAAAHYNITPDYLRKQLTEHKSVD